MQESNMALFLVAFCRSFHFIFNWNLCVLFLWFSFTEA